MDNIFSSISVQRLENITLEEHFLTSVNSNMSAEEMSSRWSPHLPMSCRTFRLSDQGVVVE